MKENSALKQNQKHYDTVTDPWLSILGDNLHYGYFKSENMNLDDASECLIDMLSSKGNIGPGTSILDVGCGVGTPAISLQKKYHCQIKGISTSNRGIELANLAAKNEDLTDAVNFEIADALDNGLANNAFDVVWQMESSHLMLDKNKLFAENYRVLKNNGELLLCDLILKKELSIAEVYQYRLELSILEKSFGKAKMVTLENYRSFLKSAGFSNIETFDISEFAGPTLNCWKENVSKNKETILSYFSEKSLGYFTQSCEILSSFFRDNILGYGIVVAKKDESL